MRVIDGVSMKNGFGDLVVGNIKIANRFAILGDSEQTTPVSVPEPRRVHKNRRRHHSPKAKAQKTVQSNMAQRVARSTAEAYGMMGKFAVVAGGAAGILQAIAGRLSVLQTLSLETAASALGTKNRALCRAPYKSRFLQAVNGFKQWEIKHFALLSALFPLVASIGYHTVAQRDPSQGLKGLGTSFLQQLKKHLLSKDQVMSVVASLVVALVSQKLDTVLGLRQGEFDSSGHTMMKMVVGAFLIKSLNTVQELGGYGSKVATGVFGMAYGLTDQILMSKTSRFCHTIPEIAAGLVWGSAVLLVGETLSRLAHKALNRTTATR